jgi:hypothetical protein
MGITAPPKASTAQLDAARQFDFWLGEWDCTWAEDGRGTNSVYHDLGDKVVVESFDGRPSLEYQGMSVSVYDRTSQRWKQTWVDSEGAYLDFVGGYENGVMDLRREAEIDGRTALYRMLWHNIERDALDWAWQRSDDEGTTWETLWAIGYRRVV